jgi:hypothetical protein
MLPAEVMQGSRRPAHPAVIPALLGESQGLTGLAPVLLSGRGMRSPFSWRAIRRTSHDPTSLVNPAIIPGHYRKLSKIIVLFTHEQAGQGQVKHAAAGQCVRCGQGHNPKAGQRLQVYPLDLNLANQAEWNLVLLCPRCQGVVRAVDWEQGRFFPVEDWLIPYRAFGS